MKAIEIALAKRWRTEGKTPGEIALLLKRDVKTIRKQTDQKKPRAKVMKGGRPPMPATVDTVLQFCFWHSSDSRYDTTMQQAVRPSLGAAADTSLTRFVATVATAVATVVATPTFCVATVATVK